MEQNINFGWLKIIIKAIFKKKVVIIAIEELKDLEIDQYTNIYTYNYLLLVFFYL